MATHHRPTDMPIPRLGMTLAFTAAAEPELADLPATVVDIWPPFPSGDYLVTLEYAAPVKVRGVWINQIEAFLSELYIPAIAPCARLPQPTRDTPKQQLHGLSPV